MVVPNNTDWIQFYRYALEADEYYQGRYQKNPNPAFSKGYPKFNHRGVSDGK